MENLVNLHDLMLEQARELYNAEYQQKEALPKLLEQASSEGLKNIIRNRIDENDEQIKGLDQAFSLLNEPQAGETSHCMKSLIQECLNLVQRSRDPEVLDAALITALQHINHYEIAGYGTTVAYAHTLEYLKVARLLYKTLEEEKTGDEMLTQIAKESVNVNAKAPVA